MARFRCEQDGIKGSFVIELHDKAKIDLARRIVAGKEKLRVHVMGTIVKSPASYNKPFRWHLDPATIDFFELAAEVCDASMHLVETDLDAVGGAFLPGNHWCPWASRPVKELGWWPW